jgi:catechol-2,3-dioxygenase
VEGDPTVYGTPTQHRDGTSSVYLKDPDGNNVEILAVPAPGAAKS